MTSQQDERLGLYSDFTLGFYDKSKYKGEMRWFPVQIKEHYGITLDDIKLDGQSLGMCKDRKCLITIDSGSTYGSMPQYAIDIMSKKGLPTADNDYPC